MKLCTHFVSSRYWGIKCFPSIVFQFLLIFQFYNLCLVGFSFPISLDYSELFVQMFSEFLRNIKWEKYTSENRQRIQKFKCVSIFYLYSRHNSEIITVHKNCHLRLLRVDSKNPVCGAQAASPTTSHNHWYFGTLLMDAAQYM